MTNDQISPFGAGSGARGPGVSGRRFPRWAIPLGIAVVVLLLIVGPAIGSYNSLVSKENRVDQSFADLDTALQRRFDLIPSLSAAVRAALRQEQAVFGEIARARTQYGGARSVEEQAAASDQLTSAFSRLLVIVEQYPQLRSNENIQNLMVQIEGTENRVQQYRRDYNAVVADYNLSIRRFPTRIWAGIFGFERKPLFQAGAGSRDAPDVDLDVTDPTPTPTQ